MNKKKIKKRSFKKLFKNFNSKLNINTELWNSCGNIAFKGLIKDQIYYKNRNIFTIFLYNVIDQNIRFEMHQLLKTSVFKLNKTDDG